jgi:hypothetical protein
VVCCALLQLAQAGTDGIGHGSLVLGPRADTAIDAYFLLYILGAKRIRDTFASFPPAHDSSGK